MHIGQAIDLQSLLTAMQKTEELATKTVTRG